MKIKLVKIYQQKIDGIRIRSKCDSYKYGEKSDVTRNTIRSITKDKKLTCHKRINQELFDFFKGLFQKILTCPRMKLYNF